MPHERFSFAAAFRIAAAPLALAAAAMILCRFTVGSSLGLCFAGIVIAVTMLPPMVVSFNRPRDAFVSAISILVGIAIVWLFSTANISQSLAASLILFAIGLSLLTITRTAKRWFGSSLAVAGTTVLFILWLTWPVWLSPWLAGSTGARIASLLAPASPPFALNHVFLNVGLWTQQPLMYQLTALGQDVPYALPTTILPCVLLHAFIALALWLPVQLSPKSSPRATA